MRAAGNASDATAPTRLLLSDGHDHCAPWLVRELRARGVAVEHVTAEQLLRAKRVEHRVGAGGVSFECELADGRTVGSRRLRAVVNRLTGVPLGSLPVKATDRDYAHAELYALWLSVLEGLSCTVLNGPTTNGMSGLYLGSAEWALRAGRAGLPVAPVRLNGCAPQPPEPPSLVVLVVCGAVFGPPAAAPLVAGCRTLAAAAGTDLLELHFQAGNGDGPQFAGASSLPDLRRGGGALADLLARQLA